MKIEVNVSDDLRWQKDAACALPGNRELFHRVDHRSRSKSTRAAMAVCTTCPVRVECAWYASTHQMTGGVWGGKFYDLKDGFYGVRERNREEACTSQSPA